MNKVNDSFDTDPFDFPFRIYGQPLDRKAGSFSWFVSSCSYIYDSYTNKFIDIGGVGVKKTSFGNVGINLECEIENGMSVKSAKIKSTDSAQEEENEFKDKSIYVTDPIECSFVPKKITIPIGGAGFAKRENGIWVSFNISMLITDYLYYSYFELRQQNTLRGGVRPI